MNPNDLHQHNQAYLPIHNGFQQMQTVISPSAHAQLTPIEADHTQVHYPPTQEVCE